MSALRSAMVRAWMAFLLTAVLVVMGSAVFVGATPAAAQDDETVTPTSEPEATDSPQATPGPDVITPAPDGAVEPGVVEEPAPAGAPEEEVIAPLPTPAAQDDEAVMPDAASEASEGSQDTAEPNLIAPAPDGAVEPGVVEPASAGAPEEKVIAPPPAGMGQSEDGDGSIAAYGLLALAGVAVLGGVAVLTWRFRARRA